MDRFTALWMSTQSRSQLSSHSSSTKKGMECARHRVPFATWRLHVYRQLLATSHPPRVTQRSFTRSARAHETSTEAEATVNPDTKRIPPSQRLPQSPLVTHPRNEPKKHRKKRATREDLEPLAKNPWAVALASPPRLCTVTGTRLPRALMGEWGLVQGPNEESLHMLPVGLFKDSLAGLDTTKSTSPEGESPSVEASTQNEDDASVRPLHNEQSGHQLVLRMVDRLPLLRKIAPKLGVVNSKGPVVTKLLPSRWRRPAGPITSRLEHSMVWRENMPEFVLRHMQLDVARKLEKTCKRFSRLGASNGVWNVLEMQEYSDPGLEDALRCLQSVDRAECGAVLLLGPFPESTLFSGTILLPQTQRTVPIFNLSELLSNADLRKLREAVASHFQHPALFFRPDDPVSIDTMLSLWKLKRFLAPDSKFGA